MGGSYGSQQSSSSSNSYGWNESLAQSMSGQNVWGPQAQGLQQLYAQVTGQMGKSMKDTPAASAAAMRAAMPGATAASTNLIDLAKTGGAISAYAKPNNALAKDQSRQYAATVGDAFRREILPGITGASIGAGGLGGSRDALARGVAAGDAADAIARGSTDLFAQQYQIGAQAAAQMGDTRLAAASALPGASESIYNLGMMPSQAAWAPLISAAGIFGGPTTLTRSLSQAQSFGENTSSSKSNSSGRQFGFNFF